MTETTEHITVLLQEAVDALITDENGFYVDGTFGRGGHSQQVLHRLASDGRLLAIDKDQQAVAAGHLRFGDDARFGMVHGSFSQLQAFLQERSQVGAVTGILLDLGVSSPQLDQAERGFSFQKDGPLDMRMDNAAGQTAADWVNQAEEAEMVSVFKEYGEERFARRIARAIIAERQASPLLTTAALSSVVAAAHPAWEKGRHPATKVFQAIRIHINNELADLDAVLTQALDMLAVGGRLVVISFHSLEDRRVKRFIQYHEKGDHLPPGLPVTHDCMNQRLKRLGKAIKPSEEELAHNPRARSAIMRVAERVQ